MTDTTLSSRHVSTVVTAPASAVYAIASDPARLSDWAAGLASSPLQHDAGGWFAEAPFGRVGVEFAATNEFGVLDHVVTMPTGEQVLNPMRVIPWGERSEVVFTVRQREDMSDDEFESDVHAVTADLATLRALVEKG